MTDKEKAIDNLQKLLYDEMREPHEKLILNVSQRLDLFKSIKDELSKPTLDDAIAVVEHLAYKHCPHGEYDNLVTKEILLEVYTALRELKEGK